MPITSLKVCRRTADVAQLREGGTVCGLMLKLTAEGWEQLELPRKKKDHPGSVVDFQVDGDAVHRCKRWYTRAGLPTNEWYLRALLFAEPGKPVLHLESNRVYKELLGIPIVERKPRR